MARYQNEKWPHPEQKKERDNDIEAADDNGSGLSPHGAMGGGGGGGAVIPRRRKSRPLGTPMIERSKFHHSGHGTADKETDVERGKTKTDNGGMGCIRRPDGDGITTIAIMEPEPLMAEKDPFFQLSYGRFALQQALKDGGFRWAEDVKTGVTSVVNISLEQAQGLCLEHDLKSMLFIEVGEERDWFHSVHFTVRRGRLVKKREYRIIGIEDGDAFGRLEKQLMMRFPDIPDAQQNGPGSAES